MKIDFKPLFYKLGNILFFLMLVFPRTQQMIKIPLVILVFIPIIYIIVTTRTVNLSKTVGIWFCFYFAYSFIWICIGALNSNPGTFDYLKLNIFWGLLYATFIVGIKDIEYFFSLVRTMIYSCIGIVVVNVILILCTLNILPSELMVISDRETSVGIYSGFVHLTSYNIGTLAFLTPFIFSLYYLMDDFEYNILDVKKNLLAFVYFAVFIISILSGRRALWLNILLTFPMCYLALFFIKKRRQVFFRLTKQIIIITIFIFSTAILITNNLNWNINDFTYRFTSAFTDETERTDQYIALMNVFYDNFIFGSGFGKGVNQCIRKPEAPWQYELSYILQLYNTGILGMTFYILLIFSVYYLIYKNMSSYINKEYMFIGLSLLIGLSNFLFANATNPTLYTYDFMWVLFFPIALINVLIKRKYNDQ